MTNNQKNINPTELLYYSNKTLLNIIYLIIALIIDIRILDKDKNENNKINNFICENLYELENKISFLKDNELNLFEKEINIEWSTDNKKLKKQLEDIYKECIKIIQ